MLRKALSKVIGLFDATERLVFIDQTLYRTKKVFVRLHETGHAFMSWQRDLYAIVEDSDQSIDPDLADQFDREANVFASEVLFQMDAFISEAQEYDFRIWTPVKLSKKYGASLYAAIRRYVSQNRKNCVVLVLNPPEFAADSGFRASLRRVISSPKFLSEFGDYPWPDSFTPDDAIGSMVPVGKQRSSGRAVITLKDLNGDTHECIAEAFTNSYQVFVLIHSTGTLTSTSVLIASVVEA